MILKLKFRILAVIMAVAAVIPAFTSCKNNKDDQNDENNNGNTEENMYYLELKEKESEIMKITDFRSDSFKNINPSLEQFCTDSPDGQFSLKWVANKGYQIKLPDEINLSEHTTIKFSVYSERKTDTPVQIRLNNPDSLRPEGAGMAPYFRMVINIDFTGRKDFVFDLETLSGNYSPTLSRISSVNFDCSGWELTPNASNVLYISDISVSKRSFEVISPLPLDSEELYSGVLAKYRELIIGYPDGSGSEIYSQKVSYISSDCKSKWDMFKASYNGGIPGSLFGLDIRFGNKGDEAKIQTLYSYILSMAKGYATSGSEYYKNSELLSDIKSGLEYAYINYYGPCVEEKGTYGNWWHWDIGIPLSLTDILIILEPDLGKELCAKYLSPFDYLNKYPSMTACNKIWITKCILASAFIQRDAERILISTHYLNDVFDYVSKGDGFYTDGSFVQHDKLAYTGGYGLSMINELTNIMYFLSGSRFEMREENVSNQYTWIFENFRPCIYDGNFMAAMRGREVDRNTSERSAHNTAVTSMIKMQAYAPQEVKDRLLPLIRHYMISTGQNYANMVPLPLVDFCVGLYSDDSIAPATGYFVTKVLGNMDRVVQHGPKYGVCISLSSTRIYKYEAINNENMDAWYHGDGMIYIYTDGYDYNYQFFNYADPYRMPGTTVNSTVRKVQNMSKPLLNSSAFSGGVEAGSYGVSVFELGYMPDNGSFDTDIKARKSYFLFDNEIVAVGSGISDSSGTDVRTIIENRLWKQNDAFLVNGTAAEPDGNEIRVSAVTAHFSGMGGYFFPGSAEITYSKATNTNSFLSIYLSHGKNPSSAKYLYVYLPESTPEQTSAYASNPDIEIIAQTDSVHAVREKTLGVTGYAFYDKAAVDGISVSAPCAIMLTENDGKLTVSVSDPTHNLSEIQVTVSGRNLTSVSENNCGADISFGADGTATLLFKVSGNVGNTYSVTMNN